MRARENLFHFVLLISYGQFCNFHTCTQVTIAGTCYLVTVYYLKESYFLKRKPLVNSHLSLITQYIFCSLKNLNFLIWAIIEIVFKKNLNFNRAFVIQHKSC